jgi:hypothetical protein
VGAVTVGPVTLSLNWMMFGMALFALGLQSFYLGCIAQTLYAYDDVARQRWLRVFPYTRTVIMSAVAFLVGVALDLPLGRLYLRHGLALEGIGWENHLAVIGLMAIITGFVTFTFTLIVHAAAVHAHR